MSDLRDLSLSDLLAAREAARAAYASAQAAAAKGIALRLDDALAILRECDCAMRCIGLDYDNFAAAVGQIRSVAAKLAGDESKVDDADD